MLRDLNFTKYTKVYILPRYTDMRQGIPGLSAIVQYQLKLDVFDEGSLFLFCGKRRNRLKALVYEGSGFTLLYHRHNDLLVGGITETEHQEHVRKLLHRISCGIRHPHLQHTAMLLFLTRHELTEVVEHLTAVIRLIRERPLVHAFVELLVLTTDQMVVVALRR